MRVERRFVAILLLVGVLLAVIANVAAMQIQVQSTAIGVGEHSEDVFAEMNSKKMLGETYMQPYSTNFLNTSKTFVASEDVMGVQGYAIYQTAKEKFCVRNYKIAANVGFAALNTTQSAFTIQTDNSSAAIKLQSLANGGIKAWVIAKNATNHTLLFRNVEMVRGLNVQLNYTAQVLKPEFPAAEANQDWLSCP